MMWYIQCISKKGNPNSEDYCSAVIYFNTLYVTYKERATHLLSIGTFLSSFRSHMTEYIVIEDDNVKFHLFQVLVNSWKRKCPTWSWPPRIIASSWATSLRQFEKQGNYHSSLWSWWYFKADSDMKGCFAQWSGYAETGHSGHAPSLLASSQNWSWTCWRCGLITEHRIENNPSNHDRRKRSWRARITWTWKVQF